MVYFYNNLTLKLVPHFLKIKIFTFPAARKFWHLCLAHLPDNLNICLQHPQKRFYSALKVYFCLKIKLFPRNFELHGLTWFFKNRKIFSFLATQKLWHFQCSWFCFTSVKTCVLSTPPRYLQHVHRTPSTHRKFYSALKGNFCVKINLFQDISSFTYWLNFLKFVMNINFKDALSTRSRYL